MDKTEAHILNLVARASADLRNEIEQAQKELDAVLTTGAKVWTPRLTAIIEASARLEVLKSALVVTDVTSEQKKSALDATILNSPYFEEQPSEGDDEDEESLGSIFKEDIAHIENHGGPDGVKPHPGTMEALRTTVNAIKLDSSLLPDVCIYASESGAVVIELEVDGRTISGLVKDAGETMVLSSEATTRSPARELLAQFDTEKLSSFLVTGIFP